MRYARDAIAMNGDERGGARDQMACALPRTSQSRRVRLVPHHLRDHRRHPRHARLSQYFTKWTGGVAPAVCCLDFDTAAR